MSAYFSLADLARLVGDHFVSTITAAIALLAIRRISKEGYRKRISGSWPESEKEWAADLSVVPYMFWTLDMTRLTRIYHGSHLSTIPTAISGFNQCVIAALLLVLVVGLLDLVGREPPRPASFLKLLLVSTGLTDALGASLFWSTVAR